MKLASYKAGRDGRLMMVSRDLQRVTSAGHIAPTMQAALDNWTEVEPALQALSDSVNTGTVGGDAFDPAQCAAPLPRAYSWNDGSVYVNHGRLMARSMPEHMKLLPAREKMVLMYQGGSDTLLGARDDIQFVTDDGWDVDFEGEYAVIMGDVPMGVSKEAALSHVRLLALVNDISLRNFLPEELGLNFGPVVGKPSSAFSPVAVTPDELGDHWSGGKLDLTLLCHHNDEMVGRLKMAMGMGFDFADVIRHLATSRGLTAGAIVGSGTISNEADLERYEVARGGPGYSCVAECRTVEKIRDGEPRTPFLRHGDRIRLEAVDENGQSIFGAIEQSFQPWAKDRLNR